MVKDIFKSLGESFLSIMPVYLVVLVLSIPLNFEPNDIISFSISSVILAMGISLFTFGTNISMIIIGNKIGNGLVKSKKLLFILFSCLIIGIFLTLAEPDLKVLASQFTAIPNNMLILTVAIGVGIFLIISALRSLYNIQLNTILIISYTIIFILLAMVPADFVPIAFDSGGVTTGPISSAFILTLGLGLSALRNDKNAKSESFGFISLCSIGPIIAVLLLGLFYNTNSTYSMNTNDLTIIQNLVFQFTKYIKEVSLSLIPIIAIYIFYSIKFNNVTRVENRKIIFGFIVTLLGLTLFLTGANVGFINAGFLIGHAMPLTFNKYLLIPLIMFIGFFIEMAEPSVKIITAQIEKVTEGSITQKVMKICISLGVSLSVGIAAYRSLTGLSIYYILVFGYLFAMLLTFIVPKVFTSIAFDCGGIVSGPLTASFLLPICIGSCMAVDGNIMTDAFGLIALLAMTPPITIQLLGLLYKVRLDKYVDAFSLDDSIIDYGVAL